MNRLILSARDMSVDDAWAAVEKADKERDVDDIKEVKPFSKAATPTTLLVSDTSNLTDYLCIRQGVS